MDVHVVERRFDMILTQNNNTYDSDMSSMPRRSMELAHMPIYIHPFQCMYIHMPVPRMVWDDQCLIDMIVTRKPSKVTRKPDLLWCTSIFSDESTVAHRLETTEQPN